MTIALAKSNAIALSTVAGVEARRATLGIDLGELCRAASVNPVTYWRALTERVTPQRRTLVKLARALDQLAGTAPPPPPAPAVVAAFWRAAVLYLAHEVGADPARALGDDGQSCPLDPAWLAASRARQLAFYLAHVELSVSHSAIAAAVGTTKQRVHKAVNRVEDLRDDAAIDALLERASAFLSGRAAAPVTPTSRKDLVP
ncbi:hypothetical protein V5F49_11145 [Xanthobacter sp. V3C-3]|uniref:hypothetical protein n=1 Tax=Xanthobacter lutulentifluminis TaxID=3119935 RepID=UPI00372B10B5